MTWEEYYDKFYDWAESTQIKKLSSVEALGSADEVTDVMIEFAFNHRDIVNRIARKAIDQKIIFSGENISDLTNLMDEALQNQLVRQSAEHFTEKDLEPLLGCIDDDLMVELYRSKRIKLPEEWAFLDDTEDYDEDETDDVDEESDVDEFNVGKGPSGFFRTIAMAFGIGHGIVQGINDATGSRPHKFRVGDHVRVRYRGQEGTVIDINGDLYMVSLNDGGYVDSYTESQLDRAW